MCDCFHLAFPNWHAASSGTGGRRLRGPEAATEDDSVSDSTCEEPARFTEGERPRPQGSSPIEEIPETEKYSDSDKECGGEHDPLNKTGSAKKSRRSGLGSMFEKRSTPKMSKLKELPSPESGVIVKTAKDGCAEGLVYGGGGKDGIFIKGVVPESPASKSLKLKEGDQVLSATVYFDNVSYEDAIQILEHAQAYKMKLCLKRKPDISQTDAPGQSDVIPEDDVYAPEMREQGKTRRRADARISWPKFPSFGKGRKAHFKRSHSSSEADEQRKLELSPTTSDTESPIKSQDALKGRKKNKMKLSVLTKRGRISSSEDPDTITTGQISSDVQQTQESDMLSPECLESPSGDAPQVYESKDEKSVGDLRLEQNNQTESGTPHDKAELISIDSTLKPTNHTVALANQDGQTAVKSPEGKKKKKEKSELKLKILGKDKSHKKAKSSPKRLKTLGASLEVSEQNDIAQTESTQTDLDSKQKGKEKTQKSKKNTGAKPGAPTELAPVGLGDATNEEATRQVSVNAEEYKPKTELLTATGAEVKGHSYDKLLKDRLSSTQLPKREDIEIPGMEDKPEKPKVKGVKESKRHREETVQMLIDVDSVKEAVSKLPGYKLPKVDTSGMPIPEEITVIDANAQRISVKTPTKVADTKTKRDTHFTKFDAPAWEDSSKPTIKLPKMRATDLTTQELLYETRLDGKKPQKQPKEIKTGAYEREDIIIPGRETAHSFDRTTSDGIKGEKTIYLQDIKISETERMTDKRWTGGFVSNAKIPEIDGIEFIDSTEGSPAEEEARVGLSGFRVNLDANLKCDASIPEITGEIKDVTAEVQRPKCAESTTDISVNMPGGDVNIARAEIESLDNEGKGGKFKMPDIGISFSKVKEPKTQLSQSKKDSTVTLPEAKAEIKCPQEINAALGSVTVSLPEQKIDAEKPELDIKQAHTEDGIDGQGNKFKMPKFGIKMPKFESPTLDINTSKTDGHVKVEDSEVKVKLPKAPEVDVTLGRTAVSTSEQKIKVEKTAMETKPLKTEGECDPDGTKFKLPKLGITMPKVKGPEVDISASGKGAGKTVPKAEGEVCTPEAELKAQVEITAPEIKVVEKDAKGSPLKFKIPTFKLPKLELGAQNVSAEKRDGSTEGAELKTPTEGSEVNIAAPSIDVVRPSIAIKGNEVEGKGGKFKIPSLGFSKPKVKGPKDDFSPSKKEVGVAPLKTDQAEKDVSLPDVNVKIPGSEVKLPEMNLVVEAPECEAESGEHEGKLKKPKFGIKLPKIKSPELDFSLSKGEVDVKTPEIEVKLPKVDGGTMNVSLPHSTIDMKKPELEMEPLEAERQQGFRFKMPNLGIKVQKMKGPETDLSLSKKDAGVKTPQSDGTAGKVEHEEQERKLKIPQFGISVPKVKGPEIHLGLSQTDAEERAPEVQADVELAAPSAKIEIKTPQTEVAADDTVASPSQFKMPHMSFSMPKIKGPDVHFTLPKTNADVKLPEVKTEVKGIDVSVPDAKMKLDKPELDVKMMGIEGEGKESKFKVPKFGISLPKVQGPEIDFNLSKKDVKSPGAKVDVKVPKASGVDINLGHVDVSSPEIKLEVKQPELEVKPLEIRGEIDGQGMKFKMPKFGVKVPQIKGPKFDVSMSKKEAQSPEAEVKRPAEIDVRLGRVDDSLLEAKMKLEKPELEVKPLKIEGELDGQGMKFKMPKFGVTKPKVKGPEVKGEIKLPEVEMKKPSGDVEVKSPERKMTTKDKKGSPSKFKMPSLKMPKLGFGTPSVSDVDVKVPEEILSINIEAPSIEAQAPTIDIKTKEIELEAKGGKFKAPSLSTKGPDIEISKKKVKVPDVKAEVEVPGVGVDVKTPNAEETGGQFKMSPFGITVPKIKGPDFNFEKKDVTLQGAKAEVHLPDVKLKGPSAEVEASEFNLPTITLPNLGAAATAEGATLTMPAGKAAVTVEAPNIDLEAPCLHVQKVGMEGEGKESKFKVPKFGISLPKVQGPEIDFNLSKKDVKSPGAKVDVKVPKASGVDINLGNVDVSSPEIKLEVKQPELEVKPLEVRGELDGQGVKFKMPKFGVTVPKVKGPEVDLNFPEVTSPGAEVSLPAVSAASAKVEIKGGNIEAQPGVLKGSPSKFKLPTFKFPKIGVTTPNVSAEIPEVDKEIKVCGADMRVAVPYTDVDVPDAKADICLPDVEVRAAGAVVELPGVEVDAKQKKTRFSLPRLSFSKSSIKVPEFDVNRQDVNVAIPEGKVDVKGGEIAVNVPECEAELDGQESKFKMPKLGITVPQLSGPDIDLSLKKKDLDVTLPEVKAEVELPTAEVKRPSAEVQIKGPGTDFKISDIEGSPSKFKLPMFKFPKFGIATPDVSVEGPSMDKDMKLEGAELEIKGPKVEVKLPDVEVQELAGSISIPQAPEVDVDAKSRKTSWTMPKFSFSKASGKAPEADLSLEAPKVEVSIPEGTVKVKQPEGDVQLDGQKSKFKFPSLGFKGPEVDLSVTRKDVEVKLPDVEVKKPSAELEMKSPEFKVETKDPDGSPSRFKMPTFKMPKFGVGSPSVSVDVPDVDKDVKLEGADIKIPEEVLTVNIEAPSIKTKGLSVDIKTKEPEQERKGSKFKFPSLGFKGPEVDLSKKDVEITYPDVKLPEVKAEVKLPEVKMKKPSVEVEVKSPGIDLKTGDVEGSPSKIKLPTFKFPKFGIATPDVCVEGPSMDKDMKLEGAELEIKGPKVEVKLPDVEVQEPAGSISIPQAPEVDVDAKSRKISWTMPRFSFSKASGKAPEADLSLEAPKVEVSIPEGTVKVKQPEGDVQLDGQKSKFKFPSLGFKGPEVDLSVTRKDVEVKLPDVEVKKPSAELEMKSPEFKVETKDPDGSPSKFKMPTFKMPKFGVGSPSVSVDVPDVDKDVKLEGADIKIPEEVLTVNIEAPSIKTKGLSVDIKTKEPEQERKGSKFKFPSLGFKGPEVDLSKKDVEITYPDVKLPEVKAEVKLPEVKMKKPSVEVEVKSPGIDLKTGDVEGSPSKIKLPTFKFPKFGIATPDVSVEGPDMDKDLKLEGAELEIKGPKVEVKLPDVEVKKPSAELEMKSPEFKVETKDSDGSPSRFKMPTFKMPKFGVGSPNVSVDVPDVDKDVKLEGADIKIPEEVLTVNIEAPSIKTKGLSVDIKTKEPEQERKGSKFKFPSLGFKGPEVDLSKKDVEITYPDVKLPEVKAEVKLPEVKMKKPSVEVEVKSPGIDLKTGDVEGSPSKIKLPTFKFPKFGIATPDVSVEGPDMDKDLKLEGAELEIKGPKVEVKLPDVEVQEPAGSIPQAPEVDVDAKSRKTSWTMPRFSFSKASGKAPEADLSLEAPKVEVSIPEGTVKVKQPEGDVQLDGQKSKFKFPSLGFKGPEVDLSVTRKDVEVKLPDVEVKKPSAELEMKSPEFKVETKDPDGSPSRFKMPTFKMPKFGVGSPSVSVDVPDVDKDVKLEGADIKIPEEVLTVNIEAPSIKTKGPTFDIKMTESEPEKRGSKFKFPSLGFKGPEVDLSKKDVEITYPDVKLPEVKAEVKLPEVKMKKPSVEVEVKSPGIDLKTGDVEGSPSKIKLPTFKFPKFGIATPDVSVEGPSMDKDLKLEGAELEIKGPKVEVKLPDVEVKKPSAELEMKSPEFKVETKDPDGSPSRFKMPTFKMPKFGVGSPSVSVDVPDVDKDVKLEGADIKIPEEVLTVNIEAPSIKTKGLSVDIKTKEPEQERKGSKFKFPSLGFKGPEVDLSKKDVEITYPDVKLPEVKAEVKLPEVKMKKPSVEVEVKSPGIDLKTGDVEGSPSKIKLPTFKFPKFGIATPDVSVEGPSMDKDMKLEGAELEIKGPKVEVKLPDVEVQELAGSISIPQAPEVDVDAKSRKTSWTMPRFSFSKASGKAPEADLSLEAPKVEVSIPEGTVKVKQPEGDVQLDGQKSKFKFPSLGFKGPEVDLSVTRKDVEVKLPDVEVKKPSAELEMKSPEFKVETKDSDGSPSRFKMPTFKMPKFGVGSPSVSVDVPDVDKDVKLEGADIKIPEEVLTVNIEAPSIKTKGPSIHIKSKGIEQEGKESKFKLPSLGFKGSEVDLSKKKVDVTLQEVKAEAQLPDVKFQKPLAKVNVEAPGFKAQQHDDMSADVKGQSGGTEDSGGKFKLPSFGISASKVKGPETEVKLKDVPEVSAEVQLPDVQDGEAGAMRPGWTFPKLSFSKSSGKVPDADFNLETAKVRVAASEAKAQVCLPDVEVKQSAMKVEINAPEIEMKSAELGIEKPKVSQTDVDVRLPELKLSAGEVKDNEAKSKDVGGLPLKFKMLIGATPSTTGTPRAEQEVQVEDVKLQQGRTVTLTGPSLDIKTDVSKAASSGSGTPKDESDAAGPGSPSKFKLPSFKMPRLSFSRTKSEEENIPAVAEHREPEEEVNAETTEVIKLPKLSSFGNILKTVDVRFDVPNAEKIEDKFETSKEATKQDKAPGPQVDQEGTKSPERTGWFSFRFGLSSPSEAPKASQKDLEKKQQSPAGETGDEDVSPSCSVQSSDAFADVSSTVTSELVGPSISSPSKVPVKYSDLDSAAGPEEIHSSIIASMTELISDIPNVPEKVTILSSGVSTSSEDTLQLQSGKIHVFTSNIQARPESQQALLLTAVQVQPSASVSLTSEATEASSWTTKDTPDGVKTVIERRLVKETSSERRESTETIVITKQISHVFESSEPISGETASSIRRLRDTVHSEKMKFFDEAEK